MTSIRLKKKAVREDCLKMRNMMSLEDVEIKSKSISKQIIDSNEYKMAKQLFCYYPMGKEVNILSIAQDALKEGKIVCFPKVVNKTTMKFYKVLSLEAFEKGKFNVMEPTSEIEVKIDDKTFMIVPGLAYDNKNYRVGYGGGYYDRYINESITNKNELYTCGVFYQWQMNGELPTDKYDEKLDCIKNEQM